MTNQEAWTIYQRYVEGWSAISSEERAKIAAEVIAADASYTTPNHAAGGRADMVGDMAGFQRQFPGGHFDIGDVSAHHDLALLTWVLVQADGKVYARGHDQIQVVEGKIKSLITFAPSVSTP